MFVSVAPIPDDPVTTFSATIDALVALDTDALDDAALSDAMVVLRRDQSRLAAVVARLTAAFDARGAWADDGSRGAAAWISARVHQPVEDVRADVRLGRRLRSMPATRAALEAGEIASCHARRLSTLAVGRTATAFRDREEL